MPRYPPLAHVLLSLLLFSASFSVTAHLIPLSFLVSTFVWFIVAFVGLRWLWRMVSR